MPQSVTESLDKKMTEKKPAPKTKKPQTKTTDTDKQSFPYTQFPVLVIHKDGKELKDTKKCYFQNMNHAEKYITRCKFKQKDYQLFIKPGTDVENMVQSTGRKTRKK